VSGGDTRFPLEERDALLALKGMGPAVVQRLEQMGIATLRQLAAAEPSEIVASAAGLTGSSCWKNSPQARAAIQSAVDFARSRA
jgi:Predicted nuclease (RecB family)